jgi:transposase
MGMTQERLSEAAKRRLRAGRMLLAGKRPAEVAAAVGVARQTVYTWKALLDEGGGRCATRRAGSRAPG